MTQNMVPLTMAWGSGSFLDVLAGKIIETETERQKDKDRHNYTDRQKHKEKNG